MGNDRDDRGIREGVLTWKGISGSAGPDSMPGLLQLLERLTDWPADGFVRKWFVHEYRLLAIVCELPDDTNVVIACNSSPVSDKVSVRVTPQVRSTGIARPLTSMEREGTEESGFDSDGDGVLEAEFSRSGQSIETMATRIKSAVDRVFGPYASTASYELSRDTRLDKMPLFMTIRVPELVAILRAIGYDATEDRPEPSAGPFISVKGEHPFGIHLEESEDGKSFATMVMVAGLSAKLSPSRVNQVNGKLPVGTVLLLDDGSAVLRFRYCLSGGTADVAVANRIDEWAQSVEIAFDAARGPVPVPTSGSLH